MLGWYVLVFPENIKVLVGGLILFLLNFNKVGGLILGRFIVGGLILGRGFYFILGVLNFLIMEIPKFI